MPGSLDRVPFVLKFNRWTSESYFCLKFWLSLLSNTGRHCIILQDLWPVDGLPKDLTNLINSFDYTPEIKCTDYSLSANFKFAKPESTHWARQGAACLTAFKLISSDYFWLIDADDTIFLTDPKIVLEKLCIAEEIAYLKNFDAFSYAFYRHVPKKNHWSLGIALLKSTIPVNEVVSITYEEISQYGIGDNIDGAFDYLRRAGRLNLQSFIFNNIVFHHHTPHIARWNTGAVYGVYDWRAGILNGRLKIPNDVFMF